MIRVTGNKFELACLEWLNGCPCSAKQNPCTLATLPRVFMEQLLRLRATLPNTGCGSVLKEGQWFRFCGETDMGQTAPALCTHCGGEYLREVWQ